MKLQDFSNELRKDPYFVIAELQLKLEEANARIAELEAQTRWIPVSERLPEKSGGCSVTIPATDPNKKCVIGATFYKHKKIPGGYFMSGINGVDITRYVIDWMPLPPPPEAQND